MAGLGAAALAAALVLLVGGPWPAAAAEGPGGCPKPPALAVAEAGLRVHTQVMVRALMCKTIEEDRAAGRPGGRLEALQDDRALPAIEAKLSAAMGAYAALTERHRTRLSGWEKEIIARHGLARFDRWRTEAASDIARREGRMSYGLDADGFCASARGQADALMRMSDGELIDAVTAAWCVINPPTAKR